MNAQPKTRSIALGLVLFALAVAVYKAALLTLDVGAGWQTLLFLIGLDFFFIALLLSMAMLHASLKSSVLTVAPRAALYLALVLMTAIYLVDSFVLLALDDHPALFDIGRYSLEWGVVRGFFDIRAVIAIGIFLFSLFCLPPFTPAIRNSCLAVLMLVLPLGVLSAVIAPQPLVRYAMLEPGELLESFRPRSSGAFYTSQQLDYYSELREARAEIPASKPDIILVVVESLSSINSKMTSGRGDLLGHFDELTKEGVLFDNFFANHQASEGGVIALLSGFPPMHFPTASPYMFDEFADQPSVTADYRRQGYFTEFLTNSDLNFIGLNRYLDGIGVDRSRGRDEVDSMAAAPRIVQDAPPDHLLYAEALATVRQHSASERSFLLVLATTSTHLPYTHPEDGPDTAEAVWAWSLLQLAAFYHQLSDEGYFEHGILIVTGDHRQMRPLTRVEMDRYGDSARARVPLLLIGKAYPPGSVDTRFFQQSDLLRMLARTETTNVLSPHPIWVERYNRKYGRPELIDKLSVFDESDGGRREYSLSTLGNHIDWLDEKPGFARKVELDIHAQRSLHQRIRNSDP